jgi:thioredoxin 1
MPSKFVTDATDATFDDVALSGDQLTIVDFWAPWCVWCKKLAPIYDQLAEKHNKQMKFVKVNVETETGLAERYGISSLPTLKYFCSGREVGEQVGAPPLNQLEAGFKALQASHKECLASSSPLDS